MRHLADVVSKKNPLLLPTTAPVTEACRKMVEAKADAVVVVDEQNRLRGIFTELDVVNRVIASGRDSESTLLSNVMTPNPATLPLTEDAIEALRLMWDGGFRHVPVVDQDRIVGVASRGDFEREEEEELERERELWEHMR